ncbi:(2Fe-2S)-binding protein [Longibacter salinarum]|uniref:(2Fe-2S)-binding protein n=1 Tax=Longibacter salinarum TaxID=1850348 RepID=A0A2A8CW19_9BACT|nr:(2Fe-2S)-binding protein [Longibacter salinarum]PEN12787.1 (2Fe-2S)-binding protein [Longibacter salinarum]
MNIDRCYCFQKPFVELRAIAETTGATSVEELQQHVEFGKKCQLCHPYVRRMLRTGDTSFDEIIREQDEPRTFASSD